MLLASLHLVELPFPSGALDGSSGRVVRAPDHRWIGVPILLPPFDHELRTTRSPLGRCLLTHIQKCPAPELEGDQHPQLRSHGAWPTACGSCPLW